MISFGIINNFEMPTYASALFDVSTQGEECCYWRTGNLEGRERPGDLSTNDFWQGGLLAAGMVWVIPMILLLVMVRLLPPWEEALLDASILSALLSRNDAMEHDNDSYHVSHDGCYCSA